MPFCDTGLPLTHANGDGLDPATGRFVYTNAGHNPPVIFGTRADRRELVRLDVTGPVIGLMADCTYLQQRVTLEEGDVLVLFTDGVSEAMNAAGDEWGEPLRRMSVPPARAGSWEDTLHRAGDGRDLVRYDAADVRKLIGARSGEIAGRVGHYAGDEVVHRDDLVVV